MKNQLFIAFLICGSILSFYKAKAAEYQSVQDSIKKQKAGLNVTWSKSEKSVGVTDEAKDDSLTGRKAPGFLWSVTFTRFDLGFTKMVDNGSFSLSPENQFLSYKSWKSSTVGFDVLQAGYRFNSAFKIYLSAGFDWTLFRLKNNITIQKNQPVLTYTTDAIDYEKNRFSASYLRMPLSFEFRTNENARGKKFRFVGGPEIGLLLNGKVKQISDEHGKQKFRDDYHFTQWRYGAFARVGYGGIGLFGKYYFSDIFENSPAQDGLKNMSFGVMFGF